MTKIHVDLTKIHVSKVRKYKNEKYETETFQNFWNFDQSLSDSDSTLINVWGAVSEIENVTES